MPEQRIWQSLMDQNDLDELMELFGRFHDSCIKELWMSTEHYVHSDLSMSLSPKLDHRVRLLIQRQFTNPAAIELLFEEVTQVFITPSPENYDSLIFEAAFLYKDGLFYWADDKGWQPDSADRFGCVTWISARKVKWRDASDWLGSTMRYGPHD